MTAEETKDALIKRFSYLENKIRIQRSRRIFADCDVKNFREVFEYAIKELKFFSELKPVFET